MRALARMRFDPLGVAFGGHPAVAPRPPPKDARHGRRIDVDAMNLDIDSYDCSVLREARGPRTTESCGAALDRKRQGCDRPAKPTDMVTAAQPSFDDLNPGY